MVVGSETQRRKYLYHPCCRYRIETSPPTPMSLPPALPPPRPSSPSLPPTDCLFPQLSCSSALEGSSSRLVPSASLILSLNGSHGFSTALKLLTRNMSWGERTESHQQDTSKNTTSGARHASVPLDFLTKENRTEASRCEASRTTGLREVYHDFIRQGQGEHEHDTPP